MKTLISNKAKTNNLINLNLSQNLLNKSKIYYNKFLITIKETKMK